MPFVSPTLVDSDGGIIWVGYKAKGEFIVQRKGSLGNVKTIPFPLQSEANLFESNY
jgi:hypothetical protein